MTDLGPRQIACKSFRQTSRKVTVEIVVTVDGKQAISSPQRSETAHARRVTFPAGG